MVSNVGPQGNNSQYCSPVQHPTGGRNDCMIVTRLLCCCGFSCCNAPKNACNLTDVGCQLSPSCAYMYALGGSSVKGQASGAWPRVMHHLSMNQGICIQPLFTCVSTCRLLLVVLSHPVLTSRRHSRMLTMLFQRSLPKSSQVWAKAPILQVCRLQVGATGPWWKCCAATGCQVMTLVPITGGS